MLLGGKRADSRDIFPQKYGIDEVSRSMFRPRKYCNCLSCRPAIRATRLGPIRHCATYESGRPLSSPIVRSDECRLAPTNIFPVIFK